MYCRTCPQHRPIVKEGKCVFCWIDSGRVDAPAPASQYERHYEATLGDQCVGFTNDGERPVMSSPVI